MDIIIIKKYIITHLGYANVSGREREGGRRNGDGQEREGCRLEEKEGIRD